ncbi:287_t:CDS:1 [Racocetra fulgida]|uniref:287_t:CDS:1 n=1 Tax=Racocetra fulgida TaxID=60492 RepID=A0A9N9GY89_9GLOM|nr:287_t:CDS:1 [Racocetra fulgida]
MKRQTPIDEVLPLPHKKVKPQSPIDEVLPLPHKKVKPQSPVDAVILLPPTREKTQSPIGQTSWFSFNSIITLQHIAVISSWIDRHSTTYDITDIPYKFILLFKGNKDEFSENTFHKLCDNIHGTIVVAKVSGANELLGGYNPLIWKESRTDCSAQTADSFIFSLQSNNSDETIISRVKNRKNAICYGTERNGPGFGRGDLRMGSNRNDSFWYCKQKDYEIPIRKISESEWFTVDEFEVFQVRRLVTN